MKPTIITITILFLVACTEKPIDEKSLFGASPGQKTELEGKEFGAPFKINRKPTPHESLNKIFPDLKVYISKESKRIVGVLAQRAYSDKASCKKALSKVRKLLSKVYPVELNSNDPRWQYSSLDGEITAGAYCQGKINPVLQLDVTHTKTNEEILKHFKKSR